MAQSLEQFKFDEQITRLDGANQLFHVMGLFAEVVLHPDAIPNHAMGSVFEELIRRFNRKKNEEGGDHDTPREIVWLMVDLLFVEDDQALRRAGVVRTLFDPTCGTGGTLSVEEECLRELNPDARPEVLGQELPSFFVLEQPSQVYFPRTLAKEAKEGDEPAVRDEDVAAARKLFDTLAAAPASSRGSKSSFSITPATKSGGGCRFTRSRSGGTARRSSLRSG